MTRLPPGNASRVFQFHSGGVCVTLESISVTQTGHGPTLAMRSEVTGAAKRSLHSHAHSFNPRDSQELPLTHHPTRPLPVWLVVIGLVVLGLIALTQSEIELVPMPATTLPCRSSRTQTRQQQPKLLWFPMHRVRSPALPRSPLISDSTPGCLPISSRKRKPASWVGSLKKGIWRTSLPEKALGEIAFSTAKTASPSNRADCGMKPISTTGPAFAEPIACCIPVMA
jgi:hypothetical protein